MKMRPNEEAILNMFPEGSTLDTIVKRVGEFFEHNRNCKLASFVESIGFDQSHPKFRSFSVIISAIKLCLSNSSHVTKTCAISDMMKDAILREVQRRLAQVVVSSRIAVYWPEDKEYYQGTIIARQGDSPSSYVLFYDDGEKETIDLSNHEFKVLNDALPEAAKAAIARPARSNSTNEGSARSAARHSTVSAAPPPTRITPELVEKGWYQKSLPNLGLVFIRPEIVSPKTGIASLVPGVDYFGTEQEVAKHLSNTNPRDVENWTTAWRELYSNGWRHEYKEDLGLVYIRPNATIHFAPDYDYFVHPRDVLAFVDEFKNPSISNITDSKPSAKRPSIAENNDESCYKRHALPSDDSRTKTLPPTSSIGQQAVKNPDESSMLQQDDLEYLRNEIKTLQGCLRSIHSLLPEDKHVPAEFKLLFTMIRDKIPADISE